MDLMKLPVRLICYAWGEAYVDRLLDYCLASVMAPGNLPALAKKFNCTVVVLTEQRLFARVNAHPITRLIGDVAALRLLSLDDLITESWQYGMTLAYTLFRGLADLGPAMTETYSLFLNADFLLADGCYERLIPRILSGERAHLSPSYCAVEEKVRPILSAHAKENQGVIAVPPRQMAELILRNRHNTIRAKTVNQKAVHFAHTDQFYWSLDDNTLLGHQMPISLIGCRPEQHLIDIEAFWDWGVAYDFCPSKNLTVLGDSDEFLMLEMRREAEHLSLVGLGKGEPGELAAGMDAYITQYQLDNARFPLTLHSRDIPDDVAIKREQLKSFVAKVLAKVSTQGIAHRGHAQWIYHRYHFDRTRRLRQETQAIQHEIDTIERTARRTKGGMRALGLDYVARLNDYRAQLEKIRKLSEDDRPKLDAMQAFLIRETGTTARPMRWFDRRFRMNKSRGIFRLLCSDRPWSPYALADGPLSSALKRLRDERHGHVLAVCPDGSELARCLETLPGGHAQSSAAAIMTLGFDTIQPDIPFFDICIIQAYDDELPYLAVVLERIGERLRPDAELRLYWANTFFVTREAWQSALKTVAMGLEDVDSRISFFKSPLASLSMRLLNRSMQLRSRLRRGIAVVTILPIALVLAALARLRGLEESDCLSPRDTSCIALRAVGRYSGHLIVRAEEDIGKNDLSGTFATYMSKRGIG
jgi:hypothetical protein